MLTEDRPITVGGAPTGRNHEFLFIEGDRIVGRVYADCLVCAWKAGRHLYPAALLASAARRSASATNPALWSMVAATSSTGSQ